MSEFLSNMGIKQHLYENLNVHAYFIKDLDERILAFLQHYNEAPYEIKTVTDDFIQSIDDLKKRFINSIVQKKHCEKRLNDAIERCERLGKEYNSSINFYLSQDMEKRRSIAYDHYGKSLAEKSVCESATTVADQEYTLCRETLLLQSKKEEQLFCDWLRRFEDSTWYNRYANQYAIPYKQESKVDDWNQDSPLYLDLDRNDDVFEREPPVTNSYPPPGYYFESKFHEKPVVNIRRNYSDSCSEEQWSKLYNNDVSSHSGSNFANPSRQRSLSAANIYSMDTKENYYSPGPLANSANHHYSKASVPCLTELQPHDPIRRSVSQGFSYPITQSLGHHFTVGESMPHIYEDLYSTSNGQNKKPKRKRSLFKFLKKRIHGPWEGFAEGWEEGA